MNEKSYLSNFQTIGKPVKVAQSKTPEINLALENLEALRENQSETRNSKTRESLWVKNVNWDYTRNIEAKNAKVPDFGLYNPLFHSVDRSPRYHKIPSY
jgi:hypothetical protein